MLECGSETDKGLEHLIETVAPQPPSAITGKTAEGQLGLAFKTHQHELALQGLPDSRSLTGRSLQSVVTGCLMKM